MAFRDQPLGELALTIPRASALFRQYDMDTAAAANRRWSARRRAKSWTSR